MFKEIYLFELLQGFKKPMNYVFAGFLFLLALFMAMVTSGVFNLSEGDSLAHVNSAHSIASYFIFSNGTVFGLINSIIIISTIATAIQKDFQYNLHPLFFTKPISKAAYYFGRFLGAFSITVLIFLSSVLGLYVGFMAGYGHPSLGEFKLVNFVQPFIIFVLPNLFLQGMIYFSLTTFFRNTLVSYLFAIIILIIQLSTSAILADIDNKTLASLIDLTGQKAFFQITSYWTPYQQNTLLIPFKDEILYNRILWLSIALAITAIGYFRFDFVQYFNPLFQFKKKIKESTLIVSKYESLADIPRVHTNHSLWNKIKQWGYLSYYEMRKIVKTPFFIIICALGFALSFIFIVFAENWQNSQYYPVTYRMIDRIGEAFYFVLVIFAVFYSGTLIWGEKESKIDELIGVTNVSNGVLFLSKLSGVLLSSLWVLIAGCITAITFQISDGYFEIDFMQYLLFILESIIEVGIITGLCIACQSIFANKYLAFFISLIPIFFWNIIMQRLQIYDPLLRFNSSGASTSYSDMNAYNGRMYVWLHYKLYWAGIVGLLGILGTMLYHRGKELIFKQRLQLNKYNGRKAKWALLCIFSCLSLYAGVTIYSENKKANLVYKPKDDEKMSAAFETQYKYLESIQQPRIIAVSLDINIFPKEKSFDINGIFSIQNKTQQPIDTIILNYQGDQFPKYKYAQLDILTPNDVIEDNKAMGLKIIKLREALQPGDSAIVHLDMQYVQVGKFTSKETMVVENGTFFNSLNFFSIGYDPNRELYDNIARKKYGLPNKERIPHLEDSQARMNNYISHDADWIRFETTISTDADQIAIAPGYLQKEWIKNERRYFHYKMDSPILNFYAFLSAKYSIKKDKWHDVDIEIYHHHAHSYNLDKMIESIKASLDYYTTHFGPYQHRQIRIIEFPRYASFAQSFPNTIPYSEGVGFITKSDENEDKIDMPFYITAHEVAHQWWAHQVIGGNVQGAEMLSESLSQYAALMVMEKTYGKTAMKKFLKHEMDEYLSNRTFESKKEMSLARVERQSYIYYAKGSLVFYALRDYLGEEVLNQALRTFLDKNKFQNPPYTTSLDLIHEIRKVTPDSLQYLVTDLFEKITLYENYIQSFEYKKREDGKYTVSVAVGSAKFYVDTAGEDRRVSDMHDYVDIGIYTIHQNKEAELLLQKVLMDAPEKTFEFIVNEKPTKAGIDPYLKLIDRKPENNTMQYGRKPPAPDFSTVKPFSVSISISNQE